MHETIELYFSFTFFGGGGGGGTKKAIPSLLFKVRGVHKIGVTNKDVVGKIIHKKAPVNKTYQKWNKAPSTLIIFLRDHVLHSVIKYNDK